MNRRHLSLLIVEDNANDFAFFRWVLGSSEEIDARIHHADRLDAGISLATSERIDVAILDLSLPDSFGLDTLLDFHDRHPLIPTIILSGHKDHDMALEAVQNGAQDYLFKGEVSPTTVSRTILYAIERHRLMNELKKAEQAQARERRFLQSLLDHLSACVAVIQGSELRYTRVNPAYQALRPEIPMPGRAYGEVFPEAADAGAEELLRRVLETGEPHFDSGYHTPIPGKLEGVWDLRIVRLPLVNEEETPSVLVIGWDVTDHKRAQEALKDAQERIRQAALHDALTGLPNRELFFEYGGFLLAAAARDTAHTALLFIDLDRFKPINDTYGHEVGDRVLQEVARRLSTSTRKSDLVGRLGGDEFVILLSTQVADSRPEAVAQHILQRIGESIRIDTLELNVTSSVGIGIFPEHGSDVESLLRAADLAMYQAKQAGRANYHVYTHELDHHAKEALWVESRLKEALNKGGLMLHYQPVVDIASGRLAAAEALIRLKSNGDATIYPGSLIPVAESTGLIAELGDWVATEACRQEADWLRQGLPPLIIAINVSPLQFRQDGFAERLGDIVAEAGIDPACLQLEVTESAIMERIDVVVEILARIKSKGIKIALDDFGTGYSSLSLLGSLPLDKLKIDKGFVRHMDDDPASLAIIRSIVTLGQNLRLEVVGEGVELESAFDHLREAGCHQAQGFLIARPMPADEFASWRQHHAH